MSLWNGDKAFRDDYEKRILSSLDGRQLSRDGRIRNPDEKPIIAPAELAPPQAETAAKPNLKRTKEEPKPVPSETVPAQKVDKEVKSKAEKPLPSEQEDKAEEIPGLEKLSKDIPKEKEVDVAKLKEMKRAEEIEKAKQAMERKKKLLEKAAAKASLRAQKEAEKKQKEIIYIHHIAVICEHTVLKFTS